MIRCDRHELRAEQRVGTRGEDGDRFGAAFGGDNGFATTDATLTGTNRDAAFLGGGQIGADYQFAPNWLVGIEGQISGLSNNDRTFTRGVDSFRDRSDWLASVTGRLGYTWGPGLIYAKGGVAFRDDGNFAFTVANLATPFVIGRETTGNAFPVPESGMHLGRERGDVLFPEDGYVSGLHCRISFQNGKLFLTDLGSSNGSFVRLVKETSISSGEILLMGQQLFRVAINA